MTEPRSERGHAERIAELEAALAATHEQLRELDHRIKNDLQLIASLFMLQMRRASPGPERDLVRGALDRVNAVLAVHRRMSPGRDMGRMDAAALVREVAEEAFGAVRREDVWPEFDLAPFTIPSRQAAPLALIVGELVRNALRHAYPSQGGRVVVRLAHAAGRVELLVADDGVGGGEDATHGFGATLVGLLAQQLRGEFERSDAAPGLRAVVRFPEAT
jgi:two-component sensor histidine kinase